MAFTRKGWGALGNAYRRRLTRAGFTPARYAAGKPLRAARGHESTRRGRTWKSLSTAYRKRLERAGITSRTYSRTKRLEAARGHAWRVQPAYTTVFYYGDVGYNFFTYRDLIRFADEHLKGHRQVNAMIVLGSAADLYGSAPGMAPTEYHWASLAQYEPLGQLVREMHEHPLRTMVPASVANRLDEVEYFTIRTQFRID